MREAGEKRNQYKKSTANDKQAGKADVRSGVHMGILALTGRDR